MSISGAQQSLMSIDCSTESTLCDEFSVISYPALRYFDGHGRMKSYRGSRRASTYVSPSKSKGNFCLNIYSITSFLKRVGRPTITVLDEAATFQSVDDTVLIAHLNPRDEHVATAFKTMASKFEDRASFALINTKGTTTIVCYNNKDEQKFKLTDFAAIDALPKLMETCLTPLIWEFTRANEMKYLQVCSPVGSNLLLN